MQTSEPTVGRSVVPANQHTNHQPDSGILVSTPSRSTKTNCWSCGDMRAAHDIYDQIRKLHIRVRDELQAEMRKTA